MIFRLLVSDRKNQLINNFFDFTCFYVIIYFMMGGFAFI
ncbi:hypothetical protein H1P_2120004 [Hyella patelloides LEGE 07179]|uniref:Uncharacterized protein n=1 Tax=Hyella patelloides LEGE 07179 TaxID=945734 RepID=A0A563VQK6_9CYAN|nr:hypothetical protein H1P_2120004 [Hyella patelloides LEGE 07179]